MNLTNPHSGMERDCAGDWYSSQIVGVQSQEKKDLGMTHGDIRRVKIEKYLDRFLFEGDSPAARRRCIEGIDGLYSWSGPTEADDNHGYGEGEDPMPVEKKLKGPLFLYRVCFRVRRFSRLSGEVIGLEDRSENVAASDKKKAVKKVFGRFGRKKRPELVSCKKLVRVK